MSFRIDKKNLNKYFYFIFLPKIKELSPLKIEQTIKIEDLLGIEEQKSKVIINTANFLNNKPSNHVLLWGARGMGKSTLIKSVVSHFNLKVKTQKKIYLIELLNNSLDFLPEIIYFLNNYNKKFIIYIDDLSLELKNERFILFKSLLEGSILSNSKNIKFYVTSNQRHLSNKPSIKKEINDINKKEISDNLISLSDRFGLWVGFHSCSKSEYLKIVKHYLKKNLIKPSENLYKLSIQWSLEKGNFSGRTAHQFVNNLIASKN